EMGLSMIIRRTMRKADEEIKGMERVAEWTAGCLREMSASAPVDPVERFAGAWSGRWTRKDNKTSGMLTTMFHFQDGQLGGWHYQEKYVLNDVTSSGDSLSFWHQYGDCKGYHSFQVEDFEKRVARSTYQVKCPAEGHAPSHSGEIRYE
ncbi:MAG: hypothetical protein K8I00_00475, partial [Candidatus Omnitrophica bacterium]|nr:hypothetical protein [Candidatus Omnitrophota bacterium]